MINAQFKLLTETAKCPSFGHEDSSNVGLDIYADEDKMIPAKGSAIISTGIAWNPIFDTKMYNNFFDKLQVLFKSRTHKIEMEIRSRSGLSINNELEVGAGTIDWHFRGEIKIHLYNNGYNTYYVKKGDRIAQGVVDAKPIVVSTITNSLTETNRGDKGFGSSGK